MLLILILDIDIDIDLLFLLHLHSLHYCYVLLGTAWPDHATIQHSKAQHFAVAITKFQGKIVGM